MMPLLKKLFDRLKTKNEIISLLMLKNRKILRRFTAQVVRTMAYLSLPVMIIICTLTVLPMTFMHTIMFQAVSFSALGAFAVLAVLFRFFNDFASKISIVLSYVMFTCLFAFALLFSFAPAIAQPYSTLIGFFLITPIIITDKRWRVNLFCASVCAIALAVSLIFKERHFFLADCLNCTIFMIVGNIIGNYTLVNQLNYIDLREGKLDRDLEVLKAKSEAKTSFLTNMSHEIRTPINSVLGFNEMILRECNDSNIIGYAKNIDVSGRTLLSLVNDILDFSRIEAGKLDIVPDTYALDSMISDLVSIISPRAEEKKLKFIVNVDPNIPNGLIGDDRRVKQCVLNLLTNAVKYTPKGTVTMDIGFDRYEKDSISLNIAVTDTGIGIKSENIDKLFEAFERIEEKKIRDIEGSGLGMKIVQQLLGKMDTYLDVQSEYGKGSRFSFAVDQGVASEEVIGDFNDRYKKSLMRHENYHETFTAPNAKLLIVDDVEINLTVARNILKRTKVKIDTASSGRQAIEMVRQKRYNIIFLDHRMPDIDGVETYQMMSAMRDNLNLDTPVIALTANAIAGAREMFIKVGFKDYLTKPIDVGQLERTMIKYLPPSLVTIVPQEQSAAVKLDGTPSLQGRDEAALVKIDASDAPSPFIVAYSQIEGADAVAAVQNSGGEEVLKEVVQNYHTDIERNAAAIEQYLSSGDIKNYTVKVHALKSSSRLVGIMRLSRDAAHLEECGDRVIKGGDGVEDSKREIEEKTPALLALYRSYNEKLKRVLSASIPAGLPSTAPPCARSSASKKPMTEEEAAEALSSLRECAEAFDFESAERILQMINEYDIPSGKREVFGKVSIAVRNADTKAVMEATNGQ